MTVQNSTGASASGVTANEQASIQEAASVPRLLIARKPSFVSGGFAE